MTSNRCAAFERLFQRASMVIFDFDGVLADSEKYHFIAYRDVFARYGHAVDETEYYKYWTSLGQGAEGEIRRHGLDLDPSVIRDEKRPVFSEYCRGGGIVLYEGMPEVVERLFAAGKTLTVASGTARPDIEAVLENAGLIGGFAAIIGSDTVGTLKPAPDVFLAALAATRRNPDECIVIEDAEKGMHASIAAGIPVVVVRTPETETFDFSAADLVVESHAELLEFARRAFPD